MATTPTSSLLVSLAILLGLVMPYCAVAINILYSGNTLAAGQSLMYERYMFIIQRDCNLVLYDAGKAVWESGTSGMGTNCRLAMQGDGNLVVYNGNNDPVWASNTSRNEDHYVLILQRDRNVVIYGGAIWATGTYVVATAGVIVTPNVTLPASVNVAGSSAAAPVDRMNLVGNGN